MSAPRVPRAILDADVIFSRVLHELIGRIATTGRFITLVWSDELIAEARHSLIARKGLAAEVAERWVGHLPSEFPEGRIDIAATRQRVDLPELTNDPHDEHVCALAVAARPVTLFTHDRGYLRAPLAALGVEVERPDTFLCRLIGVEPEAVRRILEGQASAWGGGRPIGELLDAIERAGAPAFAEQARALLAGHQ